MSSTYRRLVVVVFLAAVTALLSAACGAGNPANSTPPCPTCKDNWTVEFAYYRTVVNYEIGVDKGAVGCLLVNGTGGCLDSGWDMIQQTGNQISTFLAEIGQNLQVDDRLRLWKYQKSNLAVGFSVIYVSDLARLVNFTIGGEWVGSRIWVRVVTDSGVAGPWWSCGKCP